ncbi:hypothetical protein GCM10007301_04750 [Azorhizobium oxalatiphilum]|uniref:Uncharacterized protein n=1 Tax=Azorhizobium oxalatiphilum TaxID=980631 RepID=A0A917F4X9_9HYPH|nr:hypothetical protein GCM10007301_04750 [Azorhizobium oxalatiphilum]
MQEAARRLGGEEGAGVQFAHHRRAQRMGAERAALAEAKVGAELFSLALACRSARDRTLNALTRHLTRRLLENYLTVLA